MKVLLDSCVWGGAMDDIVAAGGVEGEVRGDGSGAVRPTSDVGTTVRY